MDKLKDLIARYGRWTDLTTYIDRIEAFLVTDFSASLENAKALLETIGKEICASKGIVLEQQASINAVLKKSFSAIGYSGETMVSQISSALATIGQNIGELRNEIGSISHGLSLEDLKARNDKVDGMTKEFLIDATVIVACFLVRAFENENPRHLLQEDAKLAYESSEDFNEFWDETYGEFEMGEYSYSASEILYSVDYPAYATEQKAFESLVEETKGNE